MRKILSLQRLLASSEPVEGGNSGTSCNCTSGSNSCQSCSCSAT